AIVRVVPREDRGESFNAGIVVHSRARRYLAAMIGLDWAVLRALAPECDPAVVQAQLDTFPRICAGDPSAGPIAALSRPERFHWLVSPSSTMVQASPVHTGLSSDPSATLAHLFATLVEGRGTTVEPPLA
ncbi:MAG: DUF3037 domain-containing protein, partial [Candidatus Limnocylindrales bacterium]